MEELNRIKKEGLGTGGPVVHHSHEYNHGTRACGRGRLSWGGSSAAIKTILEFANIPPHDIAERHVDLANFEIDPNDTGASTSPQEIRTNLSTEVLDGGIGHLGMIDGYGVMHEYFLPCTMSLRTGHTSSQNGAFIAMIELSADKTEVYLCT